MKCAHRVTRRSLDWVGCALGAGPARGQPGRSAGTTAAAPVFLGALLRQPRQTASQQPLAAASVVTAVLFLAFLLPCVCSLCGAACPPCWRRCCDGRRTPPPIPVDRACTSARILCRPGRSHAEPQEGQEERSQAPAGDAGEWGRRSLATPLRLHPAWSADRRRGGAACGSARVGMLACTSIPFAPRLRPQFDAPGDDGAGPSGAPQVRVARDMHVTTCELHASHPLVGSGAAAPRPARTAHVLGGGARARASADLAAGNRPPGCR